MNKLLIGMLLATSLVLAALGGCTIENDDGSSEKVEISAECNWYYGVECKGACHTTDFHLSCDGECNGEINLPECEASCEAECNADCELEPGSFECEGYCGGECGANCSGQCETAENSAECEGECEAFCEAECNVSCESEPAEFSCEGACGASCEGGCEGGNIDINCYVDCDYNSPIECEGYCEDEGFLECDGKFIDKKDLEAAIQWVEDNWDGEITFEGDAECAGNRCEAEGSCAFECAVGASRPRPFTGPLLLAALVAGLLLRRRFR